MRLLFSPQLNPATETGWRRTWFDIIYRHDTPPSRNFDLLLIVAIVASVSVVMLDSVDHIHATYGHVLYAIEWGFTLLFTAEYALRLAVVKRPVRYGLSSWGIIDLLSILPTYLSLFFPGSQNLLVVRILRILRLFRILKLVQYVEEGGVLVGALMTVVVIFGALMYVVEGPEHGFDSIPMGMYWAIVTMATVGFGDIAPATTLGRFITSILILIGYSVIAVPTGIYTAELASSLRQADARTRVVDNRACPDCGMEGHDPEAHFCRCCGHALPAPMG